MSTVTTQVVDPASNKVYSAAAINEAAKVQDYVDQLTQARNTEASLNQQITSDINSVQALFDSRANLIQLFKTDALAMEPALAGRNMDQIMKALPDDHPLSQLWDSYYVKIGPIVDQIKMGLADIDSKMQGFTAAQAIEANLFSQYEAWRQTATTAVPTSAQIAAGLTALQVIPTAQDAGLTASLPAIEQLDATSADLVMLQQVDAQELQTGAADPGIIASGQVQASAAAAGSNINTWGTLAVLGGFLYAIMGGSSKT